MTRIFVDTEFSRLTLDAQLISVGAVAGIEDAATVIAESAPNEAFYVELTPFPTSVSKFVRESVLTQLEGGSALCPRDEFAKRFGDWLAQWTEPRIIIVDSEWDIVLLRSTLEKRVSSPDDTLKVGEISVRIEIMSPVPDSELAHYFDARDAQQRADPRTHHALADAKVLRAGEMSRRDLVSLVVRRQR